MPIQHSAPHCGHSSATIGCSKWTWLARLGAMPLLWGALMSLANHTIPARMPSSEWTVEDTRGRERKGSLGFGPAWGK